MKKRPEAGFSLIELLLVLAIIGIISGIAIPSFLGQRRRARVIGDAKTNANALMMALEAHKAETGVYATSNTYSWTHSGGTPTASVNPAPAFNLKGNSQMDFSVVVNGGGLLFTLTAKDSQVGGATVLTADQSGTITLDPTYNK